MKDLDSRIFKEIYEIIDMANFTLDRNLLRCKIMEVLFNNVYVENSVFFLPSKKSKSTGGIEINIDQEYVNQYKKYFHQYDPIQLIKGPFYKKSVIQLEELIDYHTFVSSKFYCDFLRPQKIHYKLYINLVTAGKFQGRIALYRPVKSRRFSQEDVQILKTISPYLAHALDHNDLYINLSLKDDILKIIDNDMSTGLILLDDSMRIMYMNQMARDFCSRLLETKSCQDLFIHVPRMLLEDCYIMTEELKRCPADCLVLPKHKVLRIGNSGEFHLCSRILEKKISSVNHRLFMISINEVGKIKRIDQNGLKENYHLTDREIEIVLQVYQGLSNAEIASKLYVSEITIKKHIQNVFQKVGVKSRTALVHRILDRIYISS